MSRPLPCHLGCSVSENFKKNPYWDFLTFSPKWLGIFSPNFTRLLHVPIYARLQNFIQLSQTVTKLCHIKCHQPACIPSPLHRCSWAFVAFAGGKFTFFAGCHFAHAWNTNWLNVRWLSPQVEFTARHVMYGRVIMIHWFRPRHDTDASSSQFPRLSLDDE